MKARNITSNEELNLSDKFTEIIFDTKNGKLRCYVENGLLKVMANDSIEVFPSASNVVDIGVRKR